MRYKFKKMKLGNMQSNNNLSIRTIHFFNKYLGTNNKIASKHTKLTKNKWK